MEQQPDSNASFLTSLSENEHSQVLRRFQAIRPFLEENVALTAIADQQHVSLRTAKYWVQRYRKDGLSGLARKERSDKGQRSISPALQQVIEGLALKKPRLSVASIHRKVGESGRTCAGLPSGLCSNR